jgi:hypothetical protein
VSFLEQIDVIQGDNCDIVLSNGYVDMRGDRMTLCCGTWSNVSAAKEAFFFKEVDEQNNLSRIDFEKQA